jgi:hypothetical protein
MIGKLHRLLEGTEKQPVLVNEMILVVVYGRHVTLGRILNYYTLMLK